MVKINQNLECKIARREQITYDDLNSLPDGYPVMEFACTGNQGRSPLSEAIARDHVKENGYELLIISSGTKRAINVDGVPGIDNQLMILGRAAARNEQLRIYTESEMTELDLLLNDADKTREEYDSHGTIHDVIRAYDIRAREVFDKEEHEFRERASQEINLKTPIKKDGQQTQASKRITKLIAMGESNEEDAKKIYEESECELDSDNYGIGNTFGLPYDEYIAMVHDLKDKVEDSIDDLMEEFNDEIDEAVEGVAEASP